MEKTVSEITMTMLEGLFDGLPDEPLPIYAKVKLAINQKIQNGDWQENQRVPSELDMVKALKVSRMTVNRALRELTAEGVLVRQQGVGTFVAERNLTRRCLKCIASRKKLLRVGIITALSNFYWKPDEQGSKKR
ncbi:GntR family transcriptional regulator [Vibrio olivae]